MTTTDFIGNFVYIDSKPAWNTFDEGRVVYTSAGTCFAENYIKDHLGNVRVAYGNDGSGSLIRQVNAYYPFGMTISSLSGEPSNLRTSENEYQYNGKMFQDELGLNWYDYGARFYDPVVGRWWSVDPLAEQYRRWSPYNYCVDIPMRFIDPDGMVVDEYELNTKTGELKNVASSVNDVIYAITEQPDGSKVRTGDKIEFEGKPIEGIDNKGVSEESMAIQSIGVANTSDGDKLKLLYVNKM